MMKVKNELKYSCLKSKMKRKLENNNKFQIRKHYKRISDCFDSQFNNKVAPYFYAVYNNNILTGLRIRDRKRMLTVQVEHLNGVKRDVKQKINDYDDMVDYCTNELKNLPALDNNVTLRLIANLDEYNNLYKISGYEDITVYTSKLRNVYYKNEHEFLLTLTDDRIQDINGVYTTIKGKVKYGPIVANDVRKYITNEDVYYINSSLERDKCLELLNGLLLEKGLVKKIKLENHPPIPVKYEHCDFKVSFNNPTPNFTAIDIDNFKIPKINVKYQHIKCIEYDGTKKFGTVFLSVACNVEKLYDKGCKPSYSIYSTNVDYNKYSRVIFVFSTKRTFDLFKYANHPFINSITRLQSLIIHIKMKNPKIDCFNYMIIY